MSDIKEINNKKTNKVPKWIIFIIIYVVLFACITAFFISKYNKTGIDYSEKIVDYFNGNNSETESFLSNIVNISKPNNEEIKRVTKDDRYFINDVVFNEISESSEQMVNVSYGVEPFFSMIYYEVEGLSNRTIQTNINSEISNAANELKDEINEYITNYSENDIETINIDTNICVNANNVLSICIRRFVSHIVPEEETYDYDDSLNRNIYLNFRLDTGEKISFLDCFTIDAPIKSMVSQSYYEDAAWKYVDRLYSVDPYDDSFDFDKIEYGEIENDVFRLMAKFNKNIDNIDFSITYRYVYVYIDGVSVGINLFDNMEYMDIGTKFLTDDSLFEDGNLDNYNYMYCNPIGYVTSYFGFLSSNKFMVIEEYDYERIKKEIERINSSDDESYYNEFEQSKLNAVTETFKKYIAISDEIDDYKSYVYSINIYEKNSYNPNYKCYVNRVEFDATDHDDFRNRIQDFYYDILNKAKYEVSISMHLCDDDILRKLNPVSFDLTLNDDGSITREDNFDYWDYLYNIEE